eukprot:TRINITY_DN5747_c4_g1_i1.p1 TRINITY_DN5747_c4_g1~~TRINITY_DN5747_c4_g1_i1.p1  ORF type:complete len:304 (+),score=37.73 TRINITY_DN5747_c4_g1_i1:124-1035(+)
MAARRVSVDLTGRVAIVTGASRGIGACVARTLAAAGAHVVGAAKSLDEAPEGLPGTLRDVMKECEEMKGKESLAVRCDLRNEADVADCAQQAATKFGRIDILVNNASALWWQPIEKTPAKRYDLIHAINARGSFLMAQACMEHMRKNQFGRVVCMSPPITLNPKAYAGKTAYNHSKFGMTMVALGVSAEGAADGITGYSLWPATIIESLASINFKLGDKSTWRKPEILADATLGLCGEDAGYTGKMLIDDEYLADRHGFGPEDLVQYRCVPDVEPPRLLASEDGAWDFSRGTVKSMKGSASQA